jgi:hypothetical protein
VVLRSDSDRGARERRAQDGYESVGSRHDLGANARIGLVSMGGSGQEAWFDYVRVYELDKRTRVHNP